MLATDVIDELDALDGLRADWDELALACELPLMAPGWLLAWWRHIAPQRALLRVITVRDGARLVGLAPFYVAARRGGRVDYRLLGVGLGAPLAPLSRPGQRAPVARAIAQALGRARPRADLVGLQGTPLFSRWHVALAEAWPGRVGPMSGVYRERAQPTVVFGGKSREQWLAGRSSKFRSSMRRLARRFSERGGSWRMSTASALREDVEAFLRLHAARWRGRGHSTVLASGARMHDMLLDAGRALVGAERFRLWMTEIDGQAIAADIYVCGGGVAVGINSGWDERWKPLSPPLLATLHTIEDCIARGERRLDLGPGSESHKTRFADADNPVAWAVLMTPGRRLPQTLALTAPLLAGSAAGSLAKRVLTREQVDALRALRSRADRGIARSR